MAVRNIATSDTLETFRTEFNAEAINFGDIATLNASLTATTIVGAVNEIYSTALIGKLEGTDFTGSLLVGHGTTGTLDAATGNTGVGVACMTSLTSGDKNTCVGSASGTALTTGQYNVFMGYRSGPNITAGSYNVLIGDSVGSYGSAAGYSYNTGVGKNALYYSGAGGATSEKNTAVGWNAGSQIRQGDWNTCLGAESGDNITTGRGNLILGSVNAPSISDSRQLVIAGYDGTTTTTWISGDSAGDVTFANDITVTGSINGTFSGTVGANTVTNTSIANNAVTQAKIADDAVGHDELENVQSLIIYASAPTTATANCNGAISSSTALVVDGNSGTIAVGMIVSGTGVETTNPPSVITVTDQNNLVLSHTQTIANDVALTFTQSLKILRTAGDA